MTEEEEIYKCLHCTRARCDNCLALAEPKGRKKKDIVFVDGVGYSAEECANKLGVSFVSVYQYRRKGILERLMKGEHLIARSGPVEKKYIVFDELLTTRECAEKYDCNYNTIRTYLQNGTVEKYLRKRGLHE